MSSGASQTVTRLAGAFDANLRFPFDASAWEAFVRQSGCETTTYTDLALLTTALRNGSYAFAYLPSANCFYLRNAPYVGVASAVTAVTRLPRQTSVFVVARDNPATDWRQLRGKRYGYINTFCTTSYFAPSILLAADGFALTSFFDAFPVAPWQGQIDAVVKGSIAATMVYEDVWIANPDNAKTTKVLARISDLPTPAVIVDAGMDPSDQAGLKHVLFAMSGGGATNALYSGFADYQEASMQRFFTELAALPGAPNSA